MPPQESGPPPGGGVPPDAEVRLRVSETLAAAARGADDQRAVPGALCAACVQLLPITGASVSISGGKGVRVTWCASDRVAARLAELQYTVGDGPCQTALDHGAPVLAGDLTQGPDLGRWPIFAQEAVGLGVRAVFSLPLGVSGAAIGTLDLYSDQAGGIAEPDLRTALWVRDAVTFALVNLQAAARAGRGDHDGTAEDTDADTEDEVASWVAASEADHTEVYQAVGMVMVQLDVDPEQALDRLRGRAYAEGRTVSQIAWEVLARRLTFRPEAYGGDPGRPYGGDPGRPYAGDPGRYDGDPQHPAEESDTQGSGEQEPDVGEQEPDVGEQGRDVGDEGRDGQR